MPLPDRRGHPRYFELHHRAVRHQFRDRFIGHGGACYGQCPGRAVERGVRCGAEGKSPGRRGKRQYSASGDD